MQLAATWCRFSHVHTPPPATPQTIAEAHFPNVESQNGTVLHVIDSEGKRHTFRFRFWINNQSRM